MAKDIFFQKTMVQTSGTCELSKLLFRTENPRVQVEIKKKKKWSCFKKKYNFNKIQMPAYILTHCVEFYIHQRKYKQNH